jgi:hypothetical protein
MRLVTTASPCGTSISCLWYDWWATRALWLHRICSSVSHETRR